MGRPPEKLSSTLLDSRRTSSVIVEHTKAAWRQKTSRLASSTAPYCPHSVGQGTRRQHVSHRRGCALVHVHMCLLLSCAMASNAQASRRVHRRPGTSPCPR